jgi:hypothetical protein
MSASLVFVKLNILFHKVKGMINYESAAVPKVAEQRVITAINN